MLMSFFPGQDIPISLRMMDTTKQRRLMPPPPSMFIGSLVSMQQQKILSQAILRMKNSLTSRKLRKKMLNRLGLTFSTENAYSFGS